MQKILLTVLIGLLLTGCQQLNQSTPEQVLPPFGVSSAMVSGHRSPLEYTGSKDIALVDFSLDQDGIETIRFALTEQGSPLDFPAWEIFYQPEAPRLVLNFYTKGPGFPVLWALDDSVLVTDYQVTRRYQLDSQGAKLWYRELTLELSSPVEYRFYGDQELGMLLDLRKGN